MLLNLQKVGAKSIFFIIRNRTRNFEFTTPIHIMHQRIALDLDKLYFILVTWIFIINTVSISYLCA